MTADTFSNTLGFLIMGTGNDNNTWGGNANTAVFQILEDAIANALTSAVTGGTLDLSGSPPPAAASQVRYAGLIFTGVLGSNQTIQVPNLRKFWFVQNATSGAFTLKFKTPAGSASIAIPQNSGWQVVQCDGANVVLVLPFNSQQVQMPDGTVTAPAYSNVNEPRSGWWRAGTQDWRLSINGADVLQVTGAGASSPSVVNALSPNILQQNGSPVASITGSIRVGNFAVFGSSSTVKDAGTARITSALLAADAAPLPYVAAQTSDNLALANDATNPTRDINVTPGRVRDDSDATNMRIAATMFKRLDTAWAAGGGPSDASAAGACDSGTKGNNQTWHIFAIGKLGQAPTQYARSGTTVTLTLNGHGLGQGATARIAGIDADTLSGFDGIVAITGVTTNTFTYTSAVSGNVSTTATPASAVVDGFDILASQSYSSPTLPSGWTVKQCLGSVLTDGSANIISFKQYGDEFWLVTPQATGTFSVNVDTLQALAVPLGVKVKAIGIASIWSTTPNTNGQMIVQSPDATDPGGSLGGVSTIGETVAIVNANVASNQDWDTAQFGVWTDTSARVRVIVFGTATGYVYSHGWRDPRRRLF